MTGTISTVSFDADGTLWDFDATMRRSLAKAIEFLTERDERMGVLTVADLIDDRREVGRRSGTEVVSMEGLRRRAFQGSLKRCGSTDPALVDDVTEFYLAERFTDPALFDDVVVTLDVLALRFELVLVSNGNSDPERCGLAGVFTTTLFADRLGVAKPDPRIYERLLVEARRRAREVVHVGDSLVNDVDAAARAGLGTVWLNRSQRQGSDDLVDPDATIQSLSELPAVLDNWPDATTRCN